jgi:hypothetical protein
MNKAILSLLIIFSIVFSMGTMSAVGWVTDLSTVSPTSTVTYVNSTINITTYTTIVNNTYNVTNNITLLDGWTTTTNLAGETTLHPENLTQNVGIGTNSAAVTLEVNGTVNITGNITGSWFFGLFNWNIDPSSASWLTFNGSTLSFNYTYFASSTMFKQGTVGNTKGAIINQIDNHTQNSNNIIFAILGNGTTNVMMPHFWIQNGAGSQASGISRSFMIVNEAVTQQNTTNITSCVEYSRYANFSLRIDCNTTTTGADLLVGDDMQVVGDAFMNNTNITGLMTTENIRVNGNVSIKRPYGSWSSTETQIMTNPNTVYPITFNWTDEAYLINKEGNVNFTVTQTGQYFVSMSAIFTVDGPNSHVELWIQYYNFTSATWMNVPRSNTRMVLPSASTEAVLVVSFIMPATPEDKFRIVMATDNGGSELVYITNTSYSPETPSIIMVAHKVSELTNNGF